MRHEVCQERIIHRPVQRLIDVPVPQIIEEVGLKFGPLGVFCRKSTNHRYRVRVSCRHRDVQVALWHRVDMLCVTGTGSPGAPHCGAGHILLRFGIHGSGFGVAGLVMD